MSYLGRSAKLSLKAQEKVSFLATAGQTVKTGLSYVPSFVEVYVNGVLLTDTTDFTATNGNSITFTVALLLNDEVTVISLKTFTVADHYSKTEADTLLAAKLAKSGDTMTGDLTVQKANPTLLLQDSDEAGDGFIKFKTANGTQRGFIQTAMTANVMLLGTGTTEAMRIDSSANLLVNKTSQNLATVGAQFRGDAAGLLQVTRDDGPAIHLNRLTNDGNVLSVYKDTALKGSIAVTASGIGIQLGGTAAANTLDDYEEGTWTGVCTWATQGTGATINGGGTYTKIGDTVHAAVYLQAQKGNASGSFHIAGLPFAATDSVPASLRIDGIGATSKYLMANTNNGNTNISFLLANQSSSYGSAVTPTNMAGLAYIQLQVTYSV